MSRLRAKRVRIGKYFVPALLLLTLAVGTVAAVAYVVLTWSATLSVAANPRVHFEDWTTPTPNKENTLSVSLFNIFPGIKTIDPNYTWGIRSTSSGSSSIRIASIGTQGNIKSVNLTVYTSTATVFTRLWTTNGGAPATDWGTPFTTAAGKYTIWIEVEAMSGITTPSLSTINFELKVESP